MKYLQLGCVCVCDSAAAGPHASGAARGLAELPCAGDAAGATMEKGDGPGRAAVQEELHLLAPGLCATAADVACQHGDAMMWRNFRAPSAGFGSGLGARRGEETIRLFVGLIIQLSVQPQAAHGYSSWAP